MTQIDRREFTIGFASFGLFLAACRGNSAAEKTPTKEPERVLVREISPAPTKAEVRGILESLTPSPYKDFVFKYAYPLLLDNPPRSVTLAGEDIDIFDVTVTEKFVENIGAEIQGKFATRSFNKTPLFKLNQDTPYGLSLPFIGGNNTALEGSVTFNTGVNIGPGLEPEIFIQYSNSLYIGKDRIDDYKDLRRSILTKEAFTFAFYLAYLEATIKQMKGRGLPLYINYQGRAVEMVNSGKAGIINQKGRLSAVLDIAGEVLAIAAMGDNYKLIHDSQEQNIANLIKANGIGNTNEVIVANTINFILANRDVYKGMNWYDGDLEKTP